ncbi:hypothetical protein [Planktothrix agardhii]|jgi:hypothetical protein|uniref:hypothetical protein n=1 Tax=Planktothrix agardhii TaxID=1160 RepID=UPI001D0AEBD1|nr:hypothetical protein [Planktothrix agardhii]MCB8788744.1 hypothetical protein [Planktothrix agardhii 1025]MCF3613543.1 hypothetical protein [Planktothrix agardhii 1027]MCF3614051.1 hypothetical protein [Planktothrix agardhii 1027]MCF3644916.1 hypothetical protein [Planktothrix agardhii 1026]CAD5964568.1 hypothetical protein NO2A_03866 [Planktothrix agardhii]
MNESDQTVYDFLTFLDNPNPELLSDEVKTGLKQLQNEFKTLPPKSTKIALAIQKWCKKYPEIDQFFKNTDWQKVRCDMFKEGEEVPLPDPILDVERVINEMIIAIDKINRENESSDRPNPNEDNDPQN